VRKSLTNLEGVSEAIVDLESGTAVVTYDPTKVELLQMTEATTNSGFPSTVQQASGSE
jgi:periplasmic mercuric ion binding protein